MPKAGWERHGKRKQMAERHREDWLSLERKSSIGRFVIKDSYKRSGQDNYKPKVTLPTVQWSKRKGGANDSED